MNEKCRDFNGLTELDLASLNPPFSFAAHSTKSDANISQLSHRFTTDNPELTK